MGNSQVQEQRLTQEQRLAQSITQQQLLHAQLVELPITQLVERVNAEMDDNPAIEVAGPGEEYTDFSESSERVENSENTDYEAEERQSALDEALQSIGRDDEELPVYYGGQRQQEEGSAEQGVMAQSDSFYDQLLEQMSMARLTERERYIMEYLIGSLDDDGLLRKSLSQLSDELAIYHNLDASSSEIEHVLLQLQQFDPAGIGARSLQECLQLQIERREPSRLTELMQKAVTQYFDLFTKKHWKQLRSALSITELQADVLIRELRRLNPKPGTSMGETIGRSMQQITPDFIVDTHDDGSVTFVLNHSDVPELTVSQSFVDTLREYQTDKEHMSRQMKEALLYTKTKVDAAQNFIAAIRQRQHTLTITMQAIIQWQHRFFEEGDEALLRPMILKDIAERTGLDLSTISRVSNSKYAQTRWGTFPLRFFFSDGLKTAEGEELSTREIKVMIRDIIQHEDKRKPLSDEIIQKMLSEQGFPIARRTVTKYREQLGFPIARMRR